MDNVILGLLLLSSRTIYQLRDRIAKGMDLMFSSSMGSIQAAIKKLSNSGYITFTEIVEQGKYKKVYHITDSGRQHFMAWVNAPMEAHGAKFPELTKVYFMGFAEEANREASIQQHLTFLRQQYTVLEAICQDAEGMSVPDEFADILHYQHLSAVYGRDMMKFNIEWFETLLERMRNEKNEGI